MKGYFEVVGEGLLGGLEASSAQGLKFLALGLRCPCNTVY